MAEPGRPPATAGEAITVLMAAAGAPWEPAALTTLAQQRVTVVKRCVDLTDLLATAASGVAMVAVVSAGVPGLDADSVRRLRAHELALLAVAEPGEVERLRRLGIEEVLAEAEIGTIGAVVRSLRAAAPVPAEPTATDTRHQQPDDEPGGRVIAVWGPAGAPGRTTVAVTLAAARARSGREVVLIDADPQGGAVAQNLGVLDEVSGLLAAARRSNEGRLTPESLAACRRRVVPGLEILSGLPRADRWVEVRAGVLPHLIETCALHADVVLDVGSHLEISPRHAGPDRLTREALESADELVVVGGAEPTGLVRLARGLVDLGEVGVPIRSVVINRIRDSLGWSRADLTGMVTGYVWGVPVLFVREDREAVDRALVAGRSLIEMGEGRAAADLGVVADHAFSSGAEQQPQT